MAAASAALTMPCAPSIATCARLAAMSSRHNRLSIAIEAFIARITDPGPPAKRPPHIRLESPVRLIVLLLIGLALPACDRQNPTAEQAAAAPSASVKGVDRSHSGEAAPTVEFRDPDGGDIDLAAFRDTPLLVNLWASWCAPCVKELPTLDRLAVARDGQLGVVAVSQDMAPQSSVKAFLETHAIANLGAYQDAEMRLTSALGVQIMPTSVLYDAAGKEVWRFTGDLDWTGAEAAALLAEANPSTAR